MDRGRKYKHSLQSLCNCPRGSRKRGANALGTMVFRCPTSHTNSNIYLSSATHPRSDFPFGTSTQEEKDYTHIYTPTRVGDYRQAEERQTYHAPSCKWGDYTVVRDFRMGTAGTRSDSICMHRGSKTIPMPA